MEQLHGKGHGGAHLSYFPDLSGTTGRHTVLELVATDQVFIFAHESVPRTILVHESIRRSEIVRSTVHDKITPRFPRLSKVYAERQGGGEVETANLRQVGGENSGLGSTAFLAYLYPSLNVIPI